jgi:Skp family chaperone for outer membrane proteins
MKKYFLFLLVCFPLLAVNAQTKGVKIAYIDMNYILDKVPDYAEAKNQLEAKAQKWKQEIEVKKNDINKLKESLKVEKALLTKELIEEREEEIRFLENDLLDFQEKRFGPKGDLVTQKAVLVKPIQDQVFTVVQDVADQRKYDFVFDKSSDLTMLFAAQRHDISDLVIRRLTRAAKSKQLSPKELKQLEADEAAQDLLDDPEHQERQKALDDKKAERERKLAERKALQEQKRQEFQERREQLQRDREAKRTGTKPATNAPADSPDGTDDDTPPGNTNRPGTTTNSTQNPPGTIQGENAKEVKTTATDTPEEGKPETVNRQTAAQQAQEERARKVEERKKALEERRQKILAEREAAKKAREEQKNNTNTENKDE